MLHWFKDLADLPEYYKRLKENWQKVLQNKFGLGQIKPPIIESRCVRVVSQRTTGGINQLVGAAEQSPVHVRALELATSIAPAAWIVERLHPFANDVGSVVPEGFEAYVRVFHPAYRCTVDGSRMPVSWREIATANGRIVHPEMQFPGITGLPAHISSQDGLWDEEPEEGSLPRELAGRLATILAVHTATPESCWFAVWDGFGGLRIPQDAGPRFSIPGRDLFLLRGPIEAVTESLDAFEPFYQSANLWWPDDRAWCVATEIDFEWTYVGGSAACVQDVLADSTLKALPARLEDGITWASDRWNPCPPSGYLPNNPFEGDAA